MVCETKRSIFIAVVAACVGILIVVSLVKAVSSDSDSEESFELRADVGKKILNESATAFKVSDLPQPVVCGSFLDTRISGGDETEITQFPWTVLIEHTRDDGSVSYHCGGTLINKDYVLTAAHCIDGKDLMENKLPVTGVRLGEWDIDTDPDCQNDLCADEVVDIPIAERIVHENYHPYSRNHDNDIALLRLNQSVQFTKWIKPLCLPIVSSLRDKDYDDKNVLTIAGWGRTEDVEFSSIKMQVEVNAVPLNQCKDKYITKGVTLTANHLCAGGRDGKDSCKGDSGGPLMQFDNTNRLKPFMFLAGIVSFGKKSCGTSKSRLPGIYTRVDRYTDWILQHMRH